MSAVSHCIDDMDGKGTDQNHWDEHLDAVLLTYRVLPIDELDVSPFEIIYGRGPNLPIDNILFRENYDGPMQTLEQYLTMIHETQLNMYEALNLARKERFATGKDRRACICWVHDPCGRDGGTRQGYGPTS